MVKKGVLMFLFIAVAVLTFGIVQSGGITETVKKEAEKIVKTGTTEQDVKIVIKPNGEIVVENAKRATLDQVNEILASEFKNDKKVANWTSISVMSLNPCVTIDIGGFPYVHCW